MFIRSLTGTDGEVKFPTLGAHIGTFQSWKLTRQQDNGAHDGPFILTAVFSYVNPLLWDQPFTKSFEVRIGKKRYRLDQMPDAKCELVHKQLIMEGVTLCPLP